MGKAPRKGRDVDGFLLFDKPQCLTSNQALQAVKRLYGAAKAGHGGSLDPLATGMLPICFGAATKVSKYALDATKTYRVTARLGLATDTGDADGAITATDERPAAPEPRVRAALQALLGVRAQTPPMFSAIRHEGRRLYELAREGITVERAKRPVTIHDVRLESYAFPYVEFTVVCSKGTYVRALVEDLAASLETNGHVAVLRRLAVHPFEETRMWTLRDLESIAQDGFEALDGLLHSVDSILTDWPSVVLDAESATRLSQGQKLAAAAGSKEGLHRVYSESRAFIGIGEVVEGRTLVPRRIFCT